MVNAVMKRALLFILMVTLFACNKEGFRKHHRELVGKWQRVEVFVDPGGGGKWQEDASQPRVVLEFTSDGRVFSNDRFYSRFSRYLIQADNAIEFQSSTTGQTSGVYYSFNSETQLTLTFACIEGCGDRFIKL